MKPTDRYFAKLRGIHYLDYIRNLHSTKQPEWYLEIGTNRGKSLELSSCRTVAVDPKFLFNRPAIGSMPELHLYQTTSDEYFESELAIAETHRKTFDLIFLDGLHLFEFLLRDFINAEKLCHPESIIVMHDCVPLTPLASDRVWRKRQTKQWTGDVWKLIPILKELRPDLDITCYDCPPSGLVVVRQTDPESQVLEQSYDEIIEEFTSMRVEDFGKERLFDLLDLTSSKSTEN